MLCLCSVRLYLCVCVVFYWYYERKCTALKHIHDMAKVMWTIFESKIFIFLVSTMCYIQLHTQWQTKKKPAKKTSIIGNDASKIELLFIIFFLCFCKCLYLILASSCKMQNSNSIGRPFAFLMDSREYLYIKCTQNNLPLPTIKKCAANKCFAIVE